MYRAKSVKFEAPILTAYVPQVFGDVPIEITEVIGSTTQGMGWVFFQGGDPEFPVWQGGVGGNGGTVSDTLWVDEEPPTTTSGIELWWDEDAVAPLTIEQRWNTAWGIVASTGGTSSSQSINTTAALCNNMNVKFQSGRRYRAVCHVRAISGSAAATLSSLSTTER